MGGNYKMGKTLRQQITPSSKQEDADYAGNDEGTEDITQGEGQSFLSMPPPAEPSGWPSGSILHPTLSLIDTADHEIKIQAEADQITQISADYLKAQEGSSSSPNRSPIAVPKSAAPTSTFPSEDHKERAALMAQHRAEFGAAFRVQLREEQEFHSAGKNRQTFSHVKLPELESAAQQIPAEVFERDVANTLKTAVDALREIPEGLWGEVQRDDNTATDCATELNAAVEALLATAQELQHFPAIKAEIEEIAASESVQKSLIGFVQKDGKTAEQYLKEIIKETCAKAKKDVLKRAASSLISAAQYLQAASKVAAKTRLKLHATLSKPQLDAIAYTVGLQEISVILGKTAKKITSDPEEIGFIKKMRLGIATLDDTLSRIGDKERMRFKQSGASNVWEYDRIQMREGKDAIVQSIQTTLPAKINLGAEILFSKFGALGRKIRQYYHEEIKYTFVLYDPQEAALRAALSTAGLPLLNEAYKLDEAIAEFMGSEKKAEAEKKQRKAFASDDPTTSLQAAAEKAIQSANEAKEQVTPAQLTANRSAALALVPPALKEKAEALLKSSWNTSGTSPQKTLGHAGDSIERAANRLIGAAEKVNASPSGAKADQEAEVVNAKAWVIDAVEQVKFATIVMSGTSYGKSTRSWRVAKDLGQWLYDYKSKFLQKNPNARTEWIDNAVYAELDPSTSGDPQGQVFVKQLEMAELDAALGKLYWSTSYEDLLKQFDGLEAYLTKWGEKRISASSIRRIIYAALRGVAAALTLGTSEIGSYVLRRIISAALILLKTASEWKSRKHLLQASVRPGSALPESVDKEFTKRFYQRLAFRMSMLFVPGGAKDLIAVGLTGSGLVKNEGDYRKYFLKRLKDNLKIDLPLEGTFTGGVKSFNAMAQYGQRMAQSATIHVDDLLASLPSGNVSDLYEDEQPEIDSLEKEMSRRTESVEGPDLVDALAEEEVEAAVETFAKEGAKVTKLNTGEGEESLSSGGQPLAYTFFTLEVEPVNQPKHTVEVRRYRLGNEIYFTRAHRVGEDIPVQASSRRLVINAHGFYDDSKTSPPVSLPPGQQITFLQPHGYELQNPGPGFASQLGTGQPGSGSFTPFVTLQGEPDGSAKAVYTSPAAQSMSASGNKQSITGGVEHGVPNYTFSKYQSDDKKVSDEGYRDVRDAAAQDTTIDHLTIRAKEDNQVQLSDVFRALKDAGLQHDEIILNTCRSPGSAASAGAPSWSIADNQSKTPNMTPAAQDQQGSGVRTKGKRQGRFRHYESYQQPQPAGNGHNPSQHQQPAGNLGHTSHRTATGQSAGSNSQLQRNQDPLTGTGFSRSQHQQPTRNVGHTSHRTTTGQSAGSNSQLQRNQDPLAGTGFSRSQHQQPTRNVGHTSYRTATGQSAGSNSQLQHKVDNLDTGQERLREQQRLQGQQRLQEQQRQQHSSQLSGSMGFGGPIRPLGYDAYIDVGISEIGRRRFPEENIDPQSKVTIVYMTFSKGPTDYMEQLLNPLFYARLGEYRAGEISLSDLKRLFDPDDSKGFSVAIKEITLRDMATKSYILEIGYNSYVIGYEGDYTGPAYSDFLEEIFYLDNVDAYAEYTDERLNEFNSQNTYRRNAEAKVNGAIKGIEDAFAERGVRLNIMERLKTGEAKIRKAKLYGETVDNVFIIESVADDGQRYNAVIIVDEAGAAIHVEPEEGPLRFDLPEPKLEWWERLYHSASLPLRKKMLVYLDPNMRDALIDKYGEAIRPALASVKTSNTVTFNLSPETRNISKQGLEEGIARGFRRSAVDYANSEKTRAEEISVTQQQLGINRAADAIEGGGATVATALSFNHPILSALVSVVSNCIANGFRASVARNNEEYVDFAQNSLGNALNEVAQLKGVGPAANSVGVHFRKDMRVRKKDPNWGNWLGGGKEGSGQQGKGLANRAATIGSWWHYQYTAKGFDATLTPIGDAIKKQIRKPPTKPDPIGSNINTIRGENRPTDMRITHGKDRDDAMGDTSRKRGWQDSISSGGNRWRVTIGKQSPESFRETNNYKAPESLWDRSYSDTPRSEEDQEIYDRQANQLMIRIGRPDLVTVKGKKTKISNRGSETSNNPNNSGNDRLQLGYRGKAPSQ